MQFGVVRKKEKSSTYRISKITSTINNFNLLCRRTWCNRTNLIYNVVFTRYFLALHRYGEWILANPCNLCIFHILKRSFTWIAVPISLLALASVCFDQKLCFKNHQNPSVLDQANRATRIMIINCGFSFFFLKKVVATGMGVCFSNIFRWRNYSLWKSFALIYCH